MKFIISILLFLFVISMSIAQDATDKKLIAASEINYIEIVKRNNSEPSKPQTKRLDKKQSEEFVQKWNTSLSIGADKYISDYFVNVILLNGQKRQFNINDSKVQESGNWLTFDFKGKSYFDQLWKSIK